MNACSDGFVSNGDPSMGVSEARPRRARRASVPRNAGTGLGPHVNPSTRLHAFVEQSNTHANRRATATLTVATPLHCPSSEHPSPSPDALRSIQPPLYARKEANVTVGRVSSVRRALTSGAPPFIGVCIGGVDLSDDSQKGAKQDAKRLWRHHVPQDG